MESLPFRESGVRIIEALHSQLTMPCVEFLSYGCELVEEGSLGSLSPGMSFCTREDKKGLNQTLLETNHCVEVKCRGTKQVLCN